MKGWKRPAGAASLVALSLALLTACSVRYGSQTLGQYDLFSPYADLTTGAREVELTRAGHIAIIDIAALNPAFAIPRDYHTFTALYPLTERDSTYFPAGTHRLRHTLTNAPNRMRCDDLSIPSIGGCREELALSTRISGTPRSSTHYLLLVAEEFIDPYTVAFHLNEAILFNELLAPALFDRDAPTAAAEIAKAIADMPGLSAWSGYYLVRQN